MKNKNYVGLDILKFVFSLFIIAIHVNLLDVKISIVNLFIVKCLFRLAVPTFFAISGFLYEKKVYNLSLDSRKNITKKYIICLLIPFVFWLIIDLPFKYIEMRKTLSISSTIKELIKWGLFYQWGALWYISALIVSIILIYILRKKLSIYKICAMSIPLYLFALISNNYYFLVENTFVGNVILKYREIFISERNGIFEGLLFVSLGVIVYNYFHKNKINYKKCGVMIILAYSLFVTEVFLIKDKTSLPDGSLYLIFIILIPLIVAFFTRFSTHKKFVILRHFSTGFYFLHYSIIRIIDLLSQHFHFSIQPFLCYIIVVLLSTIIIVLCHFINNEKINKILF